MFHKKTVEELLKGSGDGEKQKLARSFGTIELTALGVGAIIGTGIFVLTGVAAAKYAGPGVVISFMISGFVASLAALSYAELSAAIPVAGSSYAYTFASMGEFAAWLIGWSLILEYLLASVAVAVGWSAYFNDFLCDLNIILPKALTSSPFSGGMINLPAVLITIIIAGIAYRGARDSALTAKVVVGIKLAVVLLFIVVGAFKIKIANWVPFAPFGFSGIVHGASIIFFAFLFTFFSLLELCRRKSITDGISISIGHRVRHISQVTQSQMECDRSILSSLAANSVCNNLNTMLGGRSISSATGHPAEHLPH